MAAVIDSCEEIETSGYGETDRGQAIEVRGQMVTLHEIVVGAYTLPEELRYRFIRERNDKGADTPYVPDAPA